LLLAVRSRRYANGQNHAEGTTAEGKCSAEGKTAEGR